MDSPPDENSIEAENIVDKNIYVTSLEDLEKILRDFNPNSNQF